MASTNYITTNGVIRGQLTSAGAYRGYCADALGSVVTTTSGGSVENTYRYKPYGAQLAKTGGAADPKFTFAGTLGYRQTGLARCECYVRTRHYGSAEGRWTSPKATTERPGDYAVTPMRPTFEVGKG